MECQSPKPGWSSDSNKHSATSYSKVYVIYPPFSQRSTAKDLGHPKELLVARGRGETKMGASGLK